MGGRLSQCGHFVDKREGSVFHNFVWTSFMDGPLQQSDIKMM